MRKNLQRLFLTTIPFLASSVAWGQEAHTAATGGDSNLFLKAALAIGAGLGIGIAAFGGGLGQGRAAAAALEGIARNPEASGKVFTPMIISLAFIESLVIYALLLSLLMFFKI